MRQPYRPSELVGATGGTNLYDYAYDATSWISGVTYSDGTPGVAYSYTDAVKTRRFDAYGRVVGYGITNVCGRGMAASLQYTGSRVDGITYTLPNGGTFTSSFTRSPSRPDLVTRRDYRSGSGSVYWYETGYDLAGRPTNANDSVSLARAYLYNRRNELAEALVGTNAFGYVYDSIGNRQWSSVNTITNSYTANCLNQYTSISTLRASASPRETNPSYDADGNLVRDDRFAYAYDADNRLVSAYPASPVDGSFAVENCYDHKHRRVRKIVRRYEGSGWQTSETHTFVWDDMNIVLERIAFADGTTRTVEYFWGNDLSGTEQGAGGVGGLVAVSVDSSFYIPCYDHNGNIVRYVSESGTIAAQYVYDPYGNVSEAVGPSVGFFSFGFSTKYHDREVGLIGYQYRFLRPSLGRWLNRDPIEEEGGENLYGFCLNSPGWRFDGLGMSCVVGTVNITKDIDIKVKSALYGGDEILVDGKSLLDSLSVLNRVIQISSLYGGVVGGVVSAVDNLIGEGLSPETASAMRAIERMLEKLKSGPLEVYGKLEWEECKCVSGQTRFVPQDPIDDKEEVSVEELYTDPKALTDARRRVFKDLVSKMYSRLGKRQ